MFAEHDREQAFVHRHVDALSFARQITMVQRRERCEGDLQADDPIGQYDRRISWFLRARFQRKPGEAGHPLNEIVISRPGRIRSALAEAKCTHVNQLFIDLTDIFVRKAKSSHGLGTDVVKKDICGRGELQKNLPACRIFQIEDDRALAAVGRKIKMPHARVFHRTREAHHVAVR